MATRKQIEANRRNSQKSTGPKTEEGKAISSQNAIKHCLHAKDFLLFFEDFDGYEAFRYKLMEDQAPQTAEEIMYIDQICQSYFLSRRAVTCMSDAFDAASRNGKPVSHTYPLFMKMKNQNDRLVHKAFEALRQIKLSRQAAADPNKPKDLQENGFVPPIYEPTPRLHAPSPPRPHHRQLRTPRIRPGLIPRTPPNLPKTPPLRKPLHPLHFSCARIRTNALHIAQIKTLS